MKNPYWLVHVPGNTHGVGAVEFDDAITSEGAISVFLNRDDNKLFFANTRLDARLVTLTYDDDGQPVFGEVKPKIRTEDGVEVGEGDKVYGYHSQMCIGTVGVIEGERKDKYHHHDMQGSTDPWFYVDFENGKRELLNGQRICSLDGAKRKGWI